MLLHRFIILQMYHRVYNGAGEDRQLVADIGLQPCSLLPLSALLSLSPLWLHPPSLRLVRQSVNHLLYFPPMYSDASSRRTVVSMTRPPLVPTLFSSTSGALAPASRVAIVRLSLHSRQIPSPGPTSGPGLAAPASRATQMCSRTGAPTGSSPRSAP